MTSRLMAPRLDAEHARRIRESMIDDPASVAFSEAMLDEHLAAPTAFPGSGGAHESREQLLRFRQDLLEAARDVASHDGAAFDLAVGRAIHEHCAGRAGEFGSAAVWDFLTLILVPDLAVRRLDAMATGSSSTSAASLRGRLTGGNRRHLLQRLWKRWLVFGPDVVEGAWLREDDYGALLERSLTASRPGLARAAAIEIKDCGLEGGARRDFTRLLMLRLLAVTGSIIVMEEDVRNRDAVLKHVVSGTLDQLMASGAAE